FAASMASLLSQLGKHAPAWVAGGQKPEDRARHIAEFQENKTRLILVNIQAGGASISLHDVHGAHPRASLVCPSFNAVDMVQVLGRIHRSGGTNVTQYLAFAAGTIEERVVSAVLKKISQIGLLNNGAGVIYPTSTTKHLNSMSPISVLSSGLP